MKEIAYTAYLQGSLRLDQAGTWWHNDVAFENPKVSLLFHKSIVWDVEAQDFVLRIGHERAFFTHAQQVFFVRALLDQESPSQILLYNETTEPLQVESLRLADNDQVLCQLSSGHTAVFTRKAYQHLLTHLIDGTTFLIDGKRITL